MLSLVYPALDLRMQKYSTKYIQHLDELRKPVLLENLAPGTPVMIRDPHFVNNNAGTRSMLQPPFLPSIHTIVKRVSDGGYLVRDELGELLERHVPLSHMKVLRSRHMPKAVGEDVYVVDHVVDRRGRTPDEAEYLIRWQGYEAKDDT